MKTVKIEYMNINMILKTRDNYSYEHKNDKKINHMNEVCYDFKSYESKGRDMNMKF